MLQQMGSLTMPTPNHLKELLGYLSTIDSLKKLQGRYSNLIEKAKYDSFCDDEILILFQKHNKDIDEKIDKLLTEAKMRLIEL